MAREFTRPGDTVFVDDPAWFLMFGSFAALGLKVVGIPRLADGPDIAQLARHGGAAQAASLYVINSVLHNPSSTSLSAAKAFQVLRLAEEHGFTIVEDDIYCDLHPGSAVQPATRLAALDQLQPRDLPGRLFEIAGGQPAGRLHRHLRRDGRSACATARCWHPDHQRNRRARGLQDPVRRACTASTPTACARGSTRCGRKRVRQMERVGLKVDLAPPAGMFVWVDAGVDTNVLAERAMAAGLLLAPGSLFSPSQLPSRVMRLNVAALQEPTVWDFLTRALRR